MRLVIELDRSERAPGDRLTGRLLVHEGGAARAVSAWLELFETTPGLTVVARRTDQLELHADDLVAPAVLPFRLALPADAPPTLRTDWGRLEWRIVVRVDRPRRRDLRVERDFVVA